MAEWVTAAAMLASVGTAVYQGEKSYELQKDVADKQEKAQQQAEEKQKQADYDAEKQRLEALASNQASTDYGSVWGVDNANKYSDAAQKLSAGTGSFNTDDDEENPFYSKGLL